MKKTIFSVLAISMLMLLSCNNKAKQNADNINSANKFDNQGKVVQMSKANFIDLVMDFEKSPKTWSFKGEKPCVVDFYADWCRPCKMVAPIMEELAKEYEGRINIYKVNVDNEKELSQFFQIESIPAILFSPVKGDPSMQAGAMSKEQYKEIFDKFLLKPVADSTKKIN
ncbi:MAG: thioredoxin [Bacteroidetes bacterium]|nr:thioredoxin [Bacteroidota bacterium]